MKTLAISNNVLYLYCMPRESPAIKINKIKVSEKMKRLLSAIIAAALMLTMLAACSSNSNANLTSDNLAKTYGEDFINELLKLYK